MDRRPPCAALVAGALLLLAAFPSGASAHGLEGLINNDYLNLGVDLGHVSRLDGSGESSLVGGLEVSWVRMREMYWGGFLAELRYEGEARSAFVALGGEGGWLFFGADLSLIARLGRESAFGARARGCFSLAVLSACAGAAVMTRGSFIEVTASAKFPVEWVPRLVRRRRS